MGQVGAGEYRASEEAVSKLGPALVTGATGFLGRELVRQLLACGREVHAVLHPGSELKKLVPGCAAHWCRCGDKTLGEMIAELKPATVFHLAALVQFSYAPRDAEYMADSNVTYGVGLADAASRAGVRHFINAGSYWQVADDGAPVNLYAATKLAFQSILSYYARATPMRVTNLILYDTYGWGDTRPKMLNLLREACRTGAPLDVTEGRQEVYMTHVCDAARAFLHAERLQYGASSTADTYGVRGETPITMRDLIAECGKAWGIAPPVRVGARAYRPREVMRPWCPPVLPGWAPWVSLADGLKEIAP